MKKKLLGGVLVLVGLVAIGLVTMAPSTYDFGAGVLDNGATTEILVGGGAGSAPVWTTATGTGAPARAGSPTFTTQITTPKVLGGTGTTQDLDLQTTSGVGTTGADMHFKVGNNGATEAMTILNSGYVGIGTTSPRRALEVSNNGDPEFVLTDSSQAVDGKVWRIYNSSGLFKFGTVNDAYTSGTDILTMNRSGYVGIGTTNPSRLLHVNSPNDTDGILIGPAIGEGASETYRMRIRNGFNDGFIGMNSGGAYLGLSVNAYKNDDNTWATTNSGRGGSGISLEETAIEFWTATTGSPPTVTERMRIVNNGNVGIGTATPNQKLTIEGTMSLKEQAAANADVAAYGQVWVANSTPNELWFTDDAGTDTQLSSHALDAPEALYTYGPGIDWIGKRVQHYLGIVFWQKIDGTVVEETFDEYNARTKDFDGHTDLIKRDWDTDQLAKLKAQKKLEGKDMAEEEVSADDAFESVEITEDVQSGESDTKYSYKVDNDGKVSVTSTEIPILIKNKTGKFKKQLKPGITFSDKTGKFIRAAHHRELIDGEVEALNLKSPEMPKWMQDWKLKKEQEKVK